MLAPVRFLRTRLFAVLIALLVLGGYAREVYAHAMPRHENNAEHQHSDSDEKGGCHHCTCHFSSGMVVSSDRVVGFQVPTCVGYVVTPGEDAPEAVPVGIDHPPQLA